MKRWGDGVPREEMPRDYPYLPNNDITAGLKYAAAYFAKQAT